METSALIGVALCEFCVEITSCDNKQTTTSEINREAHLPTYFPDAPGLGFHQPEEGVRRISGESKPRVSAGCVRRFSLQSSQPYYRAILYHKAVVHYMAILYHRAIPYHRAILGARPADSSLSCLQLPRTPRPLCTPGRVAAGAPGRKTSRRTCTLRNCRFSVA